MPLDNLAHQTHADDFQFPRTVCTDNRLATPHPPQSLSFTSPLSLPHPHLSLEPAAENILEPANRLTFSRGYTKINNHTSPWNLEIESEDLELQPSVKRYLTT
jgi:hypothetical protein